MTAAQRCRHYHDWLASGMIRTHYTGFTASISNLYRDIAAATAAEADAPDNPALLPVTLTRSVGTDIATLSLRGVSVTGSSAVLATLIRELNLC
ncbi:hypothetical protein CDU00_05030 [Cronobacter sakazakii]|nr:hypothetical protein CDU00_05030 [Cronobacter sakazakii]